MTNQMILLKESNVQNKNTMVSLNGKEKDYSANSLSEHKF